MVGIALLGAGIFAREEHLPAIAATPSFQLKAIYSRSQTSAEALASASPAASAADIYYDSPSVEGKSLDTLLARSDIAAVIIALPILTQPAVVEKALKAGKHVLSEKPVAADIAGAQTLIGWYESLENKPLWAVAENFRYIDSLAFAADKLREIDGRLATFKLEKGGFVEKGNKYFNTEWRKTPGYQGGFLLDGGVHFVAALRLLLAAAGGQEIKQLACFSALLEEHLHPVDTVNAVAITQDGNSGTIHISFGTEFKGGFEIEVVTTKGTVTWSPTSVKTVTKNESGEKVEEKKEFVYSSGVKSEMIAFGKAVEAGKLDQRQTATEALRDLEILQKLLESGESKAAVRSIEL